MARQTAYIYGNTAEKLPERPVHRERRVPQRRVNPKRKARVDKVSVALIVLTFAIAFSVCYYYIQLQFQSTYLNKSVVLLESEVVEMEKENANAIQALEQDLDLGTVYNKATKELGMRSAKRDQILSYESKKSTQIRMHKK